MKSSAVTRSVALAVVLGAALFAAKAAEQEPPPGVDRVGFPRDYATRFKLVRRTNVAQKKQVGTVYANEPAATVTDAGRLPYPNLSLIVFEWRNTKKTAEGAPIVGEEGIWQTDEVAQVDVMRRETGFGGIYGSERAGEWEFASYGPDGRSLKTGAQTVSCAQCHRGAAARDFVFRAQLPEMEKK